MENNQMDKNREQLAEENRKMSYDAYRMAAEQQERDRIAGIKPVVPSVADAIKRKLEQKEFYRKTVDGEVISTPEEDNGATI